MLCPFENFGRFFWFPATLTVYISGALNCTGVSICAASYYLPGVYDASACGALVRLLFPRSPEINGFVPLFPKTPERAPNVRMSSFVSWGSGEEGVSLQVLNKGLHEQK